MSVALRYEAKFHADETPDLGMDLAPSNPTLPYRITYPGIAGLLDATTAVAITKVYSDRVSLTGGIIGTLDLTDMIGLNGASLSFLGLKVKAIIIVADPANTTGVKVTKGATNGYLIFKTSTGEVTVEPGFPIMQLFGNNLAAVSVTVKTIDFFSTANADVEVIILAGA